MPVETEEVVVRPLSNEKIAQERAAAQRTTEIPDEPMDAADSDVISHPSADFNTMASKLEKAMNEVVATKKQPERDTGPQETKQTESKKPQSTVDPKSQPSNDTAPPDDIEAKTITSAKAADWKALKEKLKAHETQAKEWEQKHKLIETEYTEFRKKATDVAVLEQTKKEREAIQAERDKLKAQLETVALERSDEFSSFYQRKFDDAIKAAKDAVGAEAERIEQLMALPPTKWRKEQINAIREELAGVDQGQLDIAISEYDRARADKDAKLKDSKTNYQKLIEMQAERNAQEKIGMEKRRDAITSSVLQLARDYDSFKPTDDPATNEAVAKNEAFVKDFINQRLDGTALAMLPIEAVEARRYKNMVVPAMQKQIDELKAALAEFQGANPNPSGGARQESKGAPKDFITTFNELWPHGNKK